MQFSRIFITSFLFTISFISEMQGGIFGLNGDTADYVVIGLGTAGATVAKRLTDDMQTSVIAIHNGPYLSNDPLIELSENAALTVPLAYAGAPLYQNGQTIPQTNANNRQLFWALALPEGGASSINAGAYVRGTNQVYAQWEAIAGSNWSVTRILNTFKELENYQGRSSDPASRGTRGPISVLQVQNPSDISLTFAQAVTNATGFAAILDYNAPQTPIGPATLLQFTQSGPNGIYRVSSATAFLNSSILEPFGVGVHGRKLLVLPSSTGLRTIWSGNKAIGVEYLSQNGQVKRAYAKKGVIVSAGLMSSAFLMRSGVGPQALLQSLNIPVIYNNSNVGQGFVDQPGIRIIFSSDPADTSFDTNTVTGLFDQMSNLPDPAGDQTVRALRLAVANPVPGVILATFDLLQPQSRGSITINSADPLIAPAIDIGVLTNAADLAVYQRGFQTYIKAINLALQAIDPDYELVYPDPAVLDDLTLLTEFIRDEVSSNEHFQSHCRMAPLAQGGVVDSNGRVYGVQNLFVADNSIVPLCMDGAPMASAYLIGANIAQLIIDSNPRPTFNLSHR